MANIDLSTVPQYYHRYVDRVTEPDLASALEAHTNDLRSVLEGLSEAQWNYRYAPDKWSVKEMVQHIIDGERIFLYRALCFARKDKTPLPGFDENEYAAASEADHRHSKDLLEELQTVQLSAQQMFASFTDDQLHRAGIANGKFVSVLAIGYILVGHARHHINILKERYQPSAIS